MQDYYICNRLDLLTWYNGAIPEDKVYVKVGGDHGKEKTRNLSSRLGMFLSQTPARRLWCLQYSRQRTPGITSEQSPADTKSNWRT